MTCAQGLLRLLWGGARSWSATGLINNIQDEILLSKMALLCIPMVANFLNNKSKQNKHEELKSFSFE